MGNDPLWIKNLVLPNDQLDRDDDHRICVAMTSTLLWNSLDWVAFVSAAKLYAENHSIGHNPSNNV